MLNLHVVQARFGDCFIVEFGSRTSGKYILVDGGPQRVFSASLSHCLSEIVRTKTLDLVVLSHVDNDHIVGILDLFAALEEEAIDCANPRITVRGLWHNSFAQTLDSDGDMLRQLQLLITYAGATNSVIPFAADAFLGIREANSLRLLARKLSVPINAEFNGNLISSDSAPGIIDIGGLEITVIGPTNKNLEKLRRDWERWLASAKRSLGDTRALADIDRSVPNLSSLVLLLKYDGKSILMTGDARSDHILEGLKAHGFLNEASLHVDILKVPHHGSGRNVTAQFFQQVTADTYIISADGRYGNPDLSTLTWIVDAASQRGRPVEIILTNATDSTRELCAVRPRSKFDYNLNVLAKRKPKMTIPLA